MTRSATGPSPARQVEPTGPRRALIAVYGTFALAATARAGVQIATRFHEAPLAYVLSLLSGLIYIGATVGLTTRRRFGRPLAWAACGAGLVGVLTIGTTSLADAAALPADTVWSDCGQGARSALALYSLTIGTPPINISRTVPDEPKSIKTCVVGPVPATSLTVPSPYLSCETRSPTASCSTGPRGAAGFELRGAPKVFATTGAERRPCPAPDSRSG